MSEQNCRPTPDILDEATAVLREAPISSGPPADLTAAAVAAIHNRLAGAVPAEQVRRERRRRIMRYVGFSTAAAVVLGVAGFLAFGGNSAEAMFRRAMDKAAKAETVRFTWTQTSGPPGQKGKVFTTDKDGTVREYDSSSEQVMKVIAKGAKVRIEFGDVSVRLEDYAADAVLTLDHKYKLAHKFAAGGKEGDFHGLFERLAKLKPENVKPAGEEMVGKVKALKYELEKGEKTGVIAGAVWEGAKWTVWIDPKTDLPVRLRYMKDENLKWEFTDFVWNEPAEDALFEQKVPEGYKLRDETEKPKPQESEDGRTVFVNVILPALENAEKAKSFKIVATAEKDGKVEHVYTLYRDGDLLRRDEGKNIKQGDYEVLILNLKSSENLFLKTKEKTAQRFSYPADATKRIKEIMDSGFKLDKAYADEVGATLKDLGEEKLGDRTTRTWVLTHPKQGKAQVWVDPKTLLPARIRVTGDDGKSNMTIEFEKWNEELDAKLFEMKVPDGYKLIEEPKKK